MFQTLLIGSSAVGAPIADDGWLPLPSPVAKAREPASPKRRDGEEDGAGARRKDAFIVMPSADLDAA